MAKEWKYMPHKSIKFKFWADWKVGKNGPKFTKFCQNVLKIFIFMCSKNIYYTKIEEFQKVGILLCYFCLKKFRHQPKKVAKMSKFCQIWSRWSVEPVEHVVIICCCGCGSHTWYLWQRRKGCPVSSSWADVKHGSSCSWCACRRPKQLFPAWLLAEAAAIGSRPACEDKER